MKQCPNCEVQAPDQAQFCPNCGTSLAHITSTKAAPSQPHTQSVYRTYDDVPRTFSMAWYNFQTKLQLWMSIAWRILLGGAGLTEAGTDSILGMFYLGSAGLTIWALILLRRRKRLALPVYLGSLGLLMLLDTLFWSNLSDFSTAMVMLVPQLIFFAFNTAYYLKRKVLFQD